MDSYTFCALIRSMGEPVKQASEPPKKKNKAKVVLKFIATSVFFALLIWIGRVTAKPEIVPIIQDGVVVGYLAPAENDGNQWYRLYLPSSFTMDEHAAKHLIKNPKRFTGFKKRLDESD